MSKKVTDKRIAIKLEFYLRGERRIPSVNFNSVRGYGIPLTSHAASEKENAAFSAFSKAAHEFCKAMVVAGELE
jgi:hypothetical protein